MRAAALSLLLPIALTLSAAAQTRIDSINTNFRWLGPDDKIVVERYDDPKVAERVVLHVARRNGRDQGWSRICRGPEPLLDRLPRGRSCHHAASDCRSPR